MHRATTTAGAPGRDWNGARRARGPTPCGNILFSSRLRCGWVSGRGRRGARCLCSLIQMREKKSSCIGEQISISWHATSAHWPFFLRAVPTQADTTDVGVHSPTYYLVVRFKSGWISACEGANREQQLSAPPSKSIFPSQRRPGVEHNNNLMIRRRADTLHLQLFSPDITLMRGGHRGGAPCCWKRGHPCALPACADTSSSRKRLMRRGSRRTIGLGELTDEWNQRHFNDYALRDSITRPGE